MRRQIAGLHSADRCAADQIPDGLFLVRVQKVQFRRLAQKPYYTSGHSLTQSDFVSVSLRNALRLDQSLGGQSPILNSSAADPAQLPSRT